MHSRAAAVRYVLKLETRISAPNPADSSCRANTRQSILTSMRDAGKQDVPRKPAVVAATTWSLACSEDPFRVKPKADRSEEAPDLYEPPSLHIRDILPYFHDILRQLALPSSRDIRAGCLTRWRRTAKLHNIRRRSKVSLNPHATSPIPR